MSLRGSVAAMAIFSNLKPLEIAMPFFDFATLRSVGLAMITNHEVTSERT